MSEVRAHASHENTPPFNFPGITNPPELNIEYNEKNVLEVIESVERVLQSDLSDSKLTSARAEWRSTIASLSKIGNSILEMEARCLRDTGTRSLIPRNQSSDSPLKSGSRSNSLVRTTCIESIEMYPKSVLGDSVGSWRPKDEKVLAPIKSSVDEAYYKYKEALIDLDLKSACVEAFLSREIDAKLRLTRFEPECVDPEYPLSSSEEFALMSTPDELNSLDRTNTHRWLSDVLKWQQIDKDLQERSEIRSNEYRRHVHTKTQQIKLIVKKKIEAAVRLKILKLSNAALDSILVSVDDAHCNSPQMVQAPSLFPVDPANAEIR